MNHEPRRPHEQKYNLFVKFELFVVKIKII
jgi:hypothetical protein